MRVATAIFVALACAPSADATITRARYLMGTVCEVAVPTDADAAAAFAEAERIEAFLSNFRESSELSRVNRGEAEAGPELRALLDAALRWSEKTGGAFDPVAATAGHSRPASRDGGPGRAPLRIDPGAFGKGYALDRMLALLKGEAMLNFGGQILVRGSQVVTIAGPRDRHTPVLELTLTNASLSTSSNSERAHIIDPRSGRAVTPWGSVSVVSDDALTADILSTALFVMGEEEGHRWANEHGVAAIFVTNDNHIRMSAPARARNLGIKELQ